eukprot:7111954-Prymnesium_polylepis.1
MGHAWGHVRCRDHESTHPSDQQTTLFLISIIRGSPSIIIDLFVTAAASLTAASVIAASEVDRQVCATAASIGMSLHGAAIRTPPRTRSRLARRDGRMARRTEGAKICEATAAAAICDGHDVIRLPKGALLDARRTAPTTTESRMPLKVPACCAAYHHSHGLVVRCAAAARSRPLCCSTKGWGTDHRAAFAGFLRVTGDVDGLGLVARRAGCRCRCCRCLAGGRSAGRATGKGCLNGACGLLVSRDAVDRAARTDLRTFRSAIAWGARRTTQAGEPRRTPASRIASALRTCEPLVRMRWKCTHSSQQKVRRGGAKGPAHNRQASEAPTAWPARSLSKRDRDDVNWAETASARRPRASRSAIVALLRPPGRRPSALSSSRKAAALLSA